MRTVHIHEAKTHLSRLVDAASKGEPFLIARAGKPQVKVMPVESPAPKRFLRGEVTAPDDLNTMDQEQIEKLFSATNDSADAVAIAEPAGQSTRTRSTACSSPRRPSSN